MATYEEWYNSLPASTKAYAAAPGSQLLNTINQQTANSDAVFARARINDPFNYALGAGATPAAGGTAKSGGAAPAPAINPQPAPAPVAQPAPAGDIWGGVDPFDYALGARGPGGAVGGGNTDLMLRIPPGMTVEEWQRTQGNPFGGGGNPGAGSTPNPYMPPTTFQNKTPWGGAAAAGNENRGYNTYGLDPRLDSAMQFALQQALARYSDPNGRTFYSGPTVAGLTPDELAAQNLLRGLSGTAGSMGTGAQSYLETLLSNATNPQNDATLNAAIAATLKDTVQQAKDPGGIYSQIRQDALSNGALGGTRQGVAEGVASGRLADTLARTSAEMRLAGRGQNLNAAGQGLTQIPNISSALTLPASLLAGVGGQNRAQEQAYMDDLLRRWGYNTSMEDTRLQNLLNMVNGTNLGGYNAAQSWLSDAALNRGGGTSTAQNIAGGAAAAGGIWTLLRDMGIL